MDRRSATGRQILVAEWSGALTTPLTPPLDTDGYLPAGPCCTIAAVFRLPLVFGHPYRGQSMRYLNSGVSCNKSDLLARRSLPGVTGFQTACLPGDCTPLIFRLKPVLNWANVCSPNILRTVRRTMICFLIELLFRRTWFGQFNELYFILNWLVMRCKLRPELAADAQQTA